MNDLTLYKPNLPANTDEFLQNFTPAKCLRVYSRINTPALCMKCETPTIGNIRKGYGDDFIIAFIAVWIDNINDFVNAARKMSPAQMEETAIIISQEYYYLNMADINLVFRRMKKGEFGQLFAELDGVKILSWFEKYSQERMRTAAEEQINFHDTLKEDGPRSSSREPERIANMRAKGHLLIEKAEKAEKIK